jgi:hypothetical protein
MIPEKILLAHFGVISRSIDKTWKTIKTNILDVLLLHNYVVDIYLFNIDIQDSLIDNVTIPNRVNIIPYTYLETELQTEIDQKLFNTPDNDLKKFIYTDETTMKNVYRQLYSESKIASFLSCHGNNYKKVIVCGPDFYLLDKLDINLIKTTHHDIYTSYILDSNGYTNGLYLAKPNIIMKILNRINLINLIDKEYTYEKFLKFAFNHYKLSRQNIGISFIKIRANGFYKRYPGIKRIVRKYLYMTR